MVHQSIIVRNYHIATLTPTPTFAPMLALAFALDSFWVWNWLLQFWSNWEA